MLFRILIYIVKPPHYEKPSGNYPELTGWAAFFNLSVKGDIMATPKDFSKKFPFSSVRQKVEAEVVAQSIMTILSRTGDTFRPLSWDEYKIEREKEGNFARGEKAYFEDVIDFCKSEDTARLFSDKWKAVRAHVTA